MLGIQGQAQAQESDTAVLEEVTVLGSRIKRKDFVSNAPVATLGSDQIELTGTVNTESLLNTLPQAVPGFDRSSNNPGDGTATVDLRGLGAQRTLVLVNGTRATPTGSNGVVDINTIPTALIESVEVLTGGASAVYGSDALAGVVNFNLKDDFEGVEIGTSYETTEQGDADIFNLDITVGGNFADGRGNMALNFSYTDREEVFQSSRGFARTSLGDGTDANGNLILEPSGSSGVPATSIFAAGLEDFSSNTGVIFGQDGSVRPFVDSGASNDLFNFAPANFLQLPQERYQATALGHFDINEKTTAYGRLMFTSSSVPAQLAPTPAFVTSTFTLDGNPFITPEAQQVLSDAIGDTVTTGEGDAAVTDLVDSDGDGIADTATALVRRRLLEVGPRFSDDDFTSYQFQFGFRGDLAASWTYDAYVSQGVVRNSNTQLGNINSDRFQQALLLDLENDPTGGTCANPSTNGASSACAPVNIFGEGNISQAGADFIQTAVSSTSEYEQTIYAANFAGDLFELPGGTAGASFGIEHIANDFNFAPSQDLAAGTIVGFNGAPPVSGSFRVDSIFAEALLPVARDLPGAKSIDLELAFRSSDYTTIGEVSSYKIAGSWAPTDEVRFRAGFNTAVRAPNVLELFAPQGEGFPGATDPCAAEGNPTGAVSEICQATGVPANVVGSAALNLPAGQVRTLSGGNPDLKEEEADTFTIGAVFTPTAIDGLTVSVDYFDIEIEDAIANFGGGGANVLNTCFDPTDPAGGAGSAFCNVINRRADGTIDFVSITSQNVAEITLKGVDILADYNFDLLGGLARVAYLGTYTEENDTVPFEGGDTIECAGKFGNICGEPVPEYKHRMTFGWTGDKLNAQLVWRFIGSVDDDDDGTDFAVESIDEESYFDFSASYQVSDNYSINFGIDNLLDTDPTLLGDNQEQANTFPATYDVFGRTFYLAAKASF
ncbi:TonB-dependent receptor [Sessilibacter corallicola]|uniref:TonB-dependent receptor n=2 Tax=Sessilibacter corallicola TaxID=2904075 RepID=A0ABQ0ABC7_9GAMM